MMFYSLGQFNLLNNDVFTLKNRVIKAKKQDNYALYLQIGTI